MMLAVFPGQGSQKIGMGKDIYDSFASARSVFEEVNDAISFNLSNLIFNGTEDELKATENAQPALMTVSIAIVRALKEEFGIDIAEKSKLLAGHSLGEYTALCAAGVLTLPDAAKILRLRGKAMAESYPSGGAMAAIIGLKIEEVERLVRTADNPGNVVQIANDNSPLQIVISGNAEAVEKVCEEAQKQGARKAVKLDVSGPFHCRLMKKAFHKLSECLSEIEFRAPTTPIISNVTAKSENSNFKELLLRQITERVRWRESILFAEQNSVTKCVEIGSGKVLTGLIKRISPNMSLTNIDSVESISCTRCLIE